MSSILAVKLRLQLSCNTSTIFIINCRLSTSTKLKHPPQIPGNSAYPAPASPDAGSVIATISGISGGAKFIQFGEWRFGDIDGEYASISHKDGNTI